MKSHNYPGLWINFEAGEGGGKTTQYKLLAQYLKERGLFVEIGREPGTTLAGEEIRKVLMDPNLPELNPRTEMLLYVAAGIEFFEEKIKPVLIKGGIFITDRWRYSTKAYQGYGLGIDLGLIDSLIHFSCAGARPDLNFLLDIEPEEGLSNITGHEFFGKKEDKIEARNLEYHKKVNEGYRKIASENPNSFKVIPYIPGGISQMQEQIREQTERFIQENKLEPGLLKA